MRNLVLVLSALALVAESALAGVVGKDGSEIPDEISAPAPDQARINFDIIYNSAGDIGATATLGGSASGWGSHFIAKWTNTTGANLRLTEFGFPCGGLGPVEWCVWICESMPGPPDTWDFGGVFTPAISDPTIVPPTIYTYVDLSARNIIIPPGLTFYWGYQNPGIGGQIPANGTETWAWYSANWDSDAGWGRTAVLQFAANWAQPSAIEVAAVSPHARLAGACPNPFNPRTKLIFTLPSAGYAVVTIYDARGTAVTRLVAETLGGGTHFVDWDGRDTYGASVPSGTYFCRLTTPWGVETKKLQLIR